MAFTQECALTGFFFILLVVLCSGFETAVLDLQEKVIDYVYGVAERERNYVTWFDMEGKNSLLIKDPAKYKKYKVSTTASEVKYGEHKKTYVHPTVVYTQWYHNGQSIPTKVVMQRNIEHNRVTSWSFENVFRSETGTSLTFTVPIKEFTLSVGQSHKVTASEMNAYGYTTTVLEKFELKKEIVVKPGKSVKVEWIMKEYVQEIPWTAEVVAKGWFAAYYYYDIGYQYLWFYPICKITSRHLESNCEREKEDGGYVKFLAKGVFTGVNETKLEIKVSEKNMTNYKRQPLNVSCR